MACDELLETERGYVADLGTLEDMFLGPLTKWAAEDAADVDQSDVASCAVSKRRDASLLPRRRRRDRSADYPRGTRGGAATHLHGISTWHAQRGARVLLNISAKFWRISSPG